MLMVEKHKPLWLRDVPNRWRKIMASSDDLTSQKCADATGKPALTVLRPDRATDQQQSPMQDAPEQAHDHNPAHHHEHRTEDCEQSCLQCPNLQAEDMMSLTMREIFGI